ncbi:Glycosyl transferase family protein [Sulfitobacter noctilucicola]|uniref:Glycosyltransferase involved in cell wall biosynthesis n=1 Tax=Sulfitobacter noctilucicola TaxID=1342301 RepID=A0A7W6M528_9RHOB|nr:glycosyltransferase [Sulfitobacter noctilucicola]KIN62880.1 Glycosyl transferase family protein [Sulfitobacter noctilucicola]MBB4172590.1 glycosyltransferase involved in cell wall biosynthesis [Sulfitobacter noctilucicola]
MNTRHILVANVFFAPFSYGGATVVAEQVAQALIRQGGFRVTAVSLCMRKELADYSVIKSQKNGVVNYLINVPEHRKYGEMYDNPEITERLAELISALQPDMVHAHCIQDIGVGIITAAEDSGVPVVLSVHDFWWLCERQFMIRLNGTYCAQDPVRIENCKGCVDNFWAAKMRFNHLQQMSSRVALVTYPSSFAKTLSERSGFAPGLGVVWENGVNQPATDFAKKQSARRMRDKRITFGYLGGPAHIKGWPQVRQVFESLNRSDFRAIVVDGSLDQTWWSERDLKGLKGDWAIYPRFDQAQMDDFYAEIDVLLFTSQWKETFGLAIREALARGIEVIQTDSGGTVEHGTIPHHKLVPIGTETGPLKDQILGCLETGVRGQRPKQVASFDDQARAFVQLVEQVLGGEEKAA